MMKPVFKSTVVALVLTTCWAAQSEARPYYRVQRYGRVVAPAYTAPVYTTPGYRRVVPAQPYYTQPYYYGTARPGMPAYWPQQQLLSPQQLAVPPM